MFWLLLILAAILLLNTNWSVVQGNLARLYLLVGGAASRTGSLVGSRLGNILLGAVIALVLMNGVKWLPNLPSIDWRAWVPSVPSVVVEPTKATKVVYVWEKDQGGVPPGVRVSLDKLNRSGISASEFEDDSTNANQQVPTQYKVAKAEADKQGTPLLVVQSGDAVLRTVKAPKTEAEVMEATK